MCGTISLYVLKPTGAASATAVIVLNDNSDFVKWEHLHKRCYDFLSNNNIKATKMAILGKKENDVYLYKFVQIRKKNDGSVGCEVGYDCGNSMTAAGYIAAVINSETSLEIINIDTKLKVFLKISEDKVDFSVIEIMRKQINDSEWFKGTDRISLELQNRKIDASLINVCNPYIIINADSFDIGTAEQLLNLNNNIDDDVLGLLKSMRRLIIERFGMNNDSEFPKIAIVYNKEVLAARTIYLDKWHEGLPITAAISILVSGKMENSVIFNSSNKHDYILTTKGKRCFLFEYDDKKQNIVRCDFFDIKIENNYSVYQLDY